MNTSFRSVYGIVMNIVVTRRRRVTVHSYTRIAIALLCSFLAACTHSGPAAPAHEPDAKPLQRVKVLTYNTLHGLEPSGLTVKASESKEARQARLDLQFQQLSVVQPDRAAPSRSQSVTGNGRGVRHGD